ncbi:hypothetical protein ABES02_29555 [Neobacillus pocheonensis]|uniref:hypothetical protein n=1 Tax=Neobacillus pocheonensis TaxID=363869 RepID=UPI003D2CEAA6
MNMRFFMNIKRDEDFQFIYLHDPNRHAETSESIMLYHEFQGYSWDAPKTDIIEISREQYNKLSELIDNNEDAYWDLADKIMQSETRD